MDNVKFFVEGYDDLNFIKQYCNLILGANLADTDFTILGSWSGYKTGGRALPEFEINSDNDYINLLIVDADDDFGRRENEIESDKEKLKFNADIFLLPNHKDEGCLENLLSLIAIDRKLINCFEGYELCVKDYKKPLIKSKIYTYLDTLLHPYTPKSKNEDLRLVKNCDFSIKAHWDLAHKELNRLNNFLKNY